MPRPRLQFLRSPVPWVIASIAAVFLLVLLQRSPARITAANFQKVQVGMTPGALRELLGEPRISRGQFGQVRGPDTFGSMMGPATDELRQTGYRDYVFEQWTSREISIMVISDMQGNVVCRYRANSQRINPLIDLLNSLARHF